MAKFHKIKALLYDNVLAEDPYDLIARAIAERTLNVRDICESAVTRGGAKISPVRQDTDGCLASLRPTGDAHFGRGETFTSGDGRPSLRPAGASPSNLTKF